MDFNRQELDDLREALGRHLLGLRKELVSTDARNMRAGLKDLIGRYERLLARVETAENRTLAAH